MSILSQYIVFKINTGDDIGVISELTLRIQELKGTALQPTRRLLNYRTQPAPTSCAWPIHKSPDTWKFKKVEEETFVMSGLKMSLIGRPAIEALNLVSRVNSVDDLKQMYATWYLISTQAVGSSI